MRTGAHGVAVQRAPIVVAVVGGRLVELYAGDGTRDHEGAAFTWGRLWARDLVRGDSVLLHEAGEVRDEAAAWARAHPDDPALDEDEAGEAGAPPYEAQATVTLLEVTGPYAGLEVHVDRWRDDSLVVHDTRRLTLDLATRRAPVALSALVGSARADRLRRDARAALAEARRRAAAAPVASAARAAAVLGALAIDDEGWTLARDGATPAVRFLAHAPRADDAHWYELPPLAIDAPAWWDAVRGALPVRDARDSSRARLAAGALALDVATDSAGVATVRLAGGATLVRMGGPVRRLVPLGDGALALPDSAWRPALRRAFVEAGYYSDDARAVRRDLPSRRRRPLARAASRRVHPVASPSATQ